MGDKWKEKLTPKQYAVLRRKATEVPFSGSLLNHNDDGEYMCAACGTVLFKSDSKFKAPYPNEGWPSFFDVANEGTVELKEDNSHGMSRIEAICKTCGGHLGHVFNDGEPENNNGMHYCINSAALNFQPKDSKKPVVRGDS